MMLLSLRTTLLSMCLFASTTTAFDRYQGYLPTTLITDTAALDQDQYFFNEELSDRKIGSAMHVYRDGGHSGSFALLELENVGEPAQAFDKGTPVFGVAEDTTNVLGELLQDTTWAANSNSVSIKVLYNVGVNQETYVNCQVGGLYHFQMGNRDGCFAPTGTIRIGDTQEFEYTYDNRSGNQNLRSLQKLSTEAHNTMKVMGSFIPEYSLFLNYYGDTDYGDKWVSAAASKRKTDFKSERGNADFGSFKERLGQAEAMKKGTAYLNIWMQVVRDIRAAVAFCPQNTQEAEAAVDRAATLYTGSLTAIGTQDEGVLLYALAEVRAHQFRTAGHQGDKDFGDAFVNVNVMRQFKAIQDFVASNSLCKEAGEAADKLISFMKVPLIQGTLRYTYIRDKEYPADLDDQERSQAEAAVFAATILPFVHKCDSRLAKEVHDNVKIGAKTDYGVVQRALHRCYDSMGVTCEMVGAVWDTGASQYLANEPCELHIESSSGEGFFARLAKLAGISLGVLCAGWVVFRYRHRVFSGRRYRKNSLPQMHTGNIAAVAEIS